MVQQFVFWFDHTLMTVIGLWLLPIQLCTIFIALANSPTGSLLFVFFLDVSSFFLSFIGVCTYPFFYRSPPIFRLRMQQSHTVSLNIFDCRLFWPRLERPTLNYDRSGYNVVTNHGKSRMTTELKSTGHQWILVSFILKHAPANHR